MYLCTSLSSQTLQELRDDFARAVSRGCDLVEIRFDYLQPEELDKIQQLEPFFKQHADKLVVTFRSADQGGHHQGTQQERLATLMWAAGYRPRFIDFELAHYARSDEVADQVRLMSVPGGDVALEHIMMSAHHTSDRPAKLNNEFIQLSEVPAEAIKLVWSARDARDNFEALDLLRSAVKPASVFCSGPDGVPSRVLNKKLGGLVTYCALEPGAETAPGQPTLADLTDVYHWKEIDENTEVYGLIGDPVQQSLGPVVHNAAFDELGVNAVYLPFRVPADGHDFADFIKQVADRPWLHCRGFSVTSPHKHHAWILTEEDLDPLTRRLEAVNTLTFAEDTVRGDNTDYKAAIEWLSAGLGCALPDFADMNIDILGAGGLARAVVLALRLLRAQVTIYNRTKAKAEQLADAFDCAAAELNDHAVMEGDVLVNCTAVGMWPEAPRSPLKPEQIKSGSTVFDGIYNPPRTQLLNDAAARGCQTVGGLDLFLRQAALQVTIWTGQLAPVNVMREAALARIKSQPGSAERVHA